MPGLRSICTDVFLDLGFEGQLYVSLTQLDAVTSPTICLPWSASPSALNLSSQGTTSTTLCWESTAGDASERWA